MAASCINIFIKHIFFGEIARALAISPIVDAFHHSVVCLSVVCHMRAPCLNHSTDLHAIWQVHLQGPMTH